ncbi:hypothetical protein DO70_4445 [Burkholderia pseudomallei]|nr:hypothetical protein DO70_4445 [Burkholderia pseudomallei]
MRVEQRVEIRLIGAIDVVVEQVAIDVDRLVELALGADHVVGRDVLPRADPRVEAQQAVQERRDRVVQREPFFDQLLVRPLDELELLEPMADEPAERGDGNRREHFGGELDDLQRIPRMVRRHAGSSSKAPM